MDLATMIFILMIGNGVSAAIFISYYIRYKETKDSFKLFAFAKLMQTITWAIFLSHASDLTPMYMIIGNLFQYIGLLAEIIGLTMAFNLHSKKQYYWGGSIGVAFIVLFAIFSQNVPVRVLISSIFYFSLYTYLFASTFKANQRTLIVWLVGTFSIVFAGVHLTRGLMAVTTTNNMEVFTNNQIHMVIGVVYIVITFTFPLFLLLIENEKDTIRLKKLNTTKSKFFRIIGHGLKASYTQLLTIAQLIEMQKDNLDPKELEKFSNTIEEESTRTLKLLDDVLTWAKAEGESIHTSPKNLNISDLINENIKLINHKAAQKSIIILNETRANNQVFCDKNLLNTVIRNLLSNAIKFSYENEEIVVESWIEKTECTICIKDNGVGIPAERIESIFEIDTEITTLGTKMEKGTGFGLSLCKELIEKCKGRIWVISKENEGSMFFFSLPTSNNK